MNNNIPEGNRNIDLHIEELVLDGFPAQDKELITLAMQQEITRLINNGKTPAALIQNNNLSRIDGGSFQVKPGDSPGTTGIQIARSLYRGL
jgi:hypothetical protein